MKQFSFFQPYYREIQIKNTLIFWSNNTEKKNWRKYLRLDLFFLSSIPRLEIITRRGSNQTNSAVQGWGYNSLCRIRRKSQSILIN